MANYTTTSLKSDVDAQKSDDYFRGLGFGTGRQGAMDYLASAGGNSSSPSGSSTPRLDFVNTLTDSYLASDKEFATKQNDARNKLVNYYGSLEKPSDRFTRIAGEQGLSEQQTLVDSLTRNVMTNQDLIDAVEPSVNQRSKDFLINDADRTAIIARERYPLEQNLTKLLRSKEYAEVGLQGKMNMVSTLLNLSFQDDEQGAKPLQLGVDYTTEDRALAQKILGDVLGMQVNAFSGDQNTADQTAAEQRRQAFEKTMADLAYERTKEQNQTDFEQAKELTNLESTNSLNNSLALKRASGSSGTATGDKLGGIYSGKTDPEIRKIQQDTDDLWNMILSSSTTAADVKKKLEYVSSETTNADVNELKSRYFALAGEVGENGKIRKEDTGFDYNY